MISTIWLMFVKFSKLPLQIFFYVSDYETPEIVLLNLEAGSFNILFLSLIIIASFNILFLSLDSWCSP